MLTRWFAGIYISTDCRRIEAAMVGIHGRGNGAPIESRKSMSFDLPNEISDCYQNLHAPSGSLVEKAALFARLSRELAGVEEEAIEELIVESRIPAREVLAIGVFDPGFRGKSELGPIFQSLSCPDLLAEQTGLNVIDAFPSRDIACGGLGGPLLPFPAWIVLCSEEKDRLLVDLGKTARITFLPKPLQPTAYERIDYAEIVPCGGLLDELTLQLTHGKTEIDSGGHLTVQGKHIPELLGCWRELLKTQPPPRWSLQGISPTPFLQLALENAAAKNWAIRDVLCTAAHFVAESIATTVDQHYHFEEIEILLTGGGCRHGLLLNQLGKRLDGWKLTPIRECGIPVESFDAVCVAILTLLFADHIPSGIQTLTGAETARPLGRLTPGAPQNWSRLLEEISQAKPVLRNLRSAVNF